MIILMGNIGKPSSWPGTCVQFHSRVQNQSGLAQPEHFVGSRPDSPIGASPGRTRQAHPERGEDTVSRGKNMISQRGKIVAEFPDLLKLFGLESVESRHFAP